MSSSEDDPDADETDLFLDEIEPSPSIEEHNSGASNRASDDGDASVESDRPGRYAGADSSWRNHVRDEIATATALAEADNDNLSIHLYNAHAWKRQNSRASLPSKFLHWCSKRTLTQPGELSVAPFLPPTRWTAWPLEPSDVPRSQEQWGVPAERLEDDEVVYSKHEAWKPSLNLQEELKCTFLRRAKEVFVQHLQDSSSNINLDESDFSDANDGEEDDKIIKQESGAETRSEECSVVFSEDDERTVAMMDDDEEAGAILQPIVRHILSNLDDLLVALHTSRQGHRIEKSSVMQDDRFGSRSKSLSRADIRKSAKRKRPISDTESDEDEDLASSQQKVRIRQKNLLGVRDWSEVLGMATIVGWDPAIIAAAATRCAALFREDTNIRIMPNLAAIQSQKCLLNILPNMTLPCKPTPGNTVDAKDEPRHACPFQTCPRNEEPYTVRWRLREHLKRKHKQSKEEIATIEEDLNRNAHRYQ